LLQNNNQRAVLAAGLCVAFIFAPAETMWSQNPQQPTPQDLPQQGGLQMKVTREGMRPIKMAVADFRQSTTAGSATPDALAKVFNDVLWSDLESCGLFTMVGKSFYPKDLPGRAEDLQGPAMAAWAQPPTSTEALVFGNLSTAGDRLDVNGFLFDVTGRATQPQQLGRHYANEALPEAARVMAHRFANEIITLLGGGIQGIGESRIYFVSTRAGKDAKGNDIKEVWVMDYDGANQQRITRYNNLTVGPAVSPDGSKLAYTSFFSGNPNIYILSLDSGRQLTFHNLGPHLNTAPSFSPDGNHVAFAASRGVATEIYLGDATGASPVQLTHTTGVNISPAINPRNPDQIAFVSERGGNAQVYIMDSKGGNVRRISGGGGEAVTPAWSPNGQYLAFSWTRGYAPGNYNIFVMDVSSGKLGQLTYGAGANEHPSWSPDGRHIVFESNRSGKKKQIYTMLADGSQVRALTSTGENLTPVWSVR
jgi:TolB protein